MTIEQGIVFAVLAIAMALFVWGRWRYDVVAIVALLPSSPRPIESWVMT